MVGERGKREEGEAERKEGRETERDINIVLSHTTSTNPENFPENKKPT